MSPTMVWAKAISPPPPIPWRARARMRKSMVGAIAQAMEPAMKITIPVSRVTRLPWLSLILP